MLKNTRFLILSFCGSLINDLNAQPSKTRANDSGLLTVLGGRSKTHRGAFQSLLKVYINALLNDRGVPKIMVGAVKYL